MFPIETMIIAMCIGLIFRFSEKKFYVCNCILILIFFVLCEVSFLEWKTSSEILSLYWKITWFLCVISFIFLINYKIEK